MLHVMKRFLKYMILSAAAIAAVACAKETVVKSEGEESADEGVTFTAFMQSENPTAETKVAIDIDATAKTAKVSFTAGDFVAVYDGKNVDRITLNAENINPDGSATFTAKNVSPTAESYLAYVSDKKTLGSFDENHVYTNVTKDANRDDFVEIASGRTPHAAFASCSGTEGCYRSRICSRFSNSRFPQQAFLMWNSRAITMKM